MSLDRRRERLAGTPLGLYPGVPASAMPFAAGPTSSLSAIDGSSPEAPIYAVAQHQISVEVAPDSGSRVPCNKANRRSVFEFVSGTGGAHGIPMSAPVSSTVDVPGHSCKVPDSVPAAAALRKQGQTMRTSIEGYSSASITPPLTQRHPSSLFAPVTPCQPPASASNMDLLLESSQPDVLMDHLVALTTSARTYFAQGEFSQIQLCLDSVASALDQLQKSSFYRHNSPEESSNTSPFPGTPAGIAPSLSSTTILTPASYVPTSLEFPAGAQKRTRDGDDDLAHPSIKSLRTGIPSSCHRQSMSQPCIQALAGSQGVTSALSSDIAPLRHMPPFRPASAAASLVATATDNSQLMLDMHTPDQSQFFPTTSQSSVTATHEGNRAGTVAHQSPAPTFPLASERLAQSADCSIQPPSRVEAQSSMPTLDMRVNKSTCKATASSLYSMRQFRPTSAYSHARAASDSYLASTSNSRSGLPKPAFPASVYWDDDPSDADQVASSLPSKLRTQLDEVLLDFLNMLCSDLDYKDRRGDPVHQLLMAKRMARLDEAPDFRPFRFRIQAFTNSFHDMARKRGLSDPGVSLKMLKLYLWSQPLIARYNEDGRKAKSRGNYNWIIDARKRPEGGWEFREFTRRIAGAPMRAYLNVPWMWKLRMWDPIVPSTAIHATFRVKNAPSWVKWENEATQDTLVGTPASPDDMGQLTVVANYIRNGQVQELEQTFLLEVVHAALMDQTATSISSAGTFVSDGRIRYPGDTGLNSSHSKLATPEKSPSRNGLQPPPSSFQFPRCVQAQGWVSGTNGASSSQEPILAAAQPCTSTDSDQPDAFSSTSIDYVHTLHPLRRALEMRQEDQASHLLLSLPAFKDGEQNPATQLAQLPEEATLHLQNEMSVPSPVLEMASDPTVMLEGPADSSLQASMSSRRVQEDTLAFALGAPCRND